MTHSSADPDCLKGKDEHELWRLLPELSDRYRFACRIEDAGQIYAPGAYCCALATAKLV
jgi:hypothetical protein